MKTLTIALSVLLVLALAACAPAAPTSAPAEEAPAASEPAAPQPAAETAASEPVTVSLWFHSGRGEERDALNQSLVSFAAERSDIIVDAVELPEGSYNDQVQAAAFANDLPCLLDFDGPFVHNYVWGGFMIPLDGYVDEAMRSDFLPSIINQGTLAPSRMASCTA